MGIEPTTEAWEAAILPLNYACMLSVTYHTTRGGQKSRGKGKFSPVNRLPESAGWTGDGSGAGMCGNRKEERRRTAAAAGGGKSRRRRKQTPSRSARRRRENAAQAGIGGVRRGRSEGKRQKAAPGDFPGAAPLSRRRSRRQTVGFSDVAVGFSDVVTDFSDVAAGFSDFAAA